MEHDGCSSTRWQRLDLEVGTGGRLVVEVSKICSRWIIDDQENLRFHPQGGICAIGACIEALAFLELNWARGINPVDLDCGAGHELVTGFIRFLDRLLCGDLESGGIIAEVT